MIWESEAILTSGGTPPAGGTGGTDVGGSTPHPV